MFCCFSSKYVYESLMYFTLLLHCDFFLFQYRTFPFARGFSFLSFILLIAYECFVTIPCTCKTNEIKVQCRYKKALTKIRMILTFINTNLECTFILGNSYNNKSITMDTFWRDHTCTQLH